MDGPERFPLTVRSGPFEGAVESFRNRPKLVAGIVFLSTLFGMATASVLSLHTRGFLPITWHVYPIEKIEHEEGNAYVGRISRAGYFPHEGPRSAVVLENGIPFPRVDTTSQDIRKVGEGKFNLSPRRVLFSASDNTDPRSNQKTYELFCPIPLSGSLRMVIYGCAAGLIALACFLTAVILVPYARTFSDSRVAKLLNTTTFLLGPPPFAISVVVFFLALALQGVNFWMHFTDPEIARTGFSVLGVPFTDGRGWHLMGESISCGQGMHAAWPAFRPGYGIFLALFYTWTGASHTLAIVLNLVLAALTSALLCSLGERLLNRWVGVAIGVGFALQRLTLVYPLTMATETAGLFFSVASLHQLILGVQTGKQRAFLLGGVFLAMSNLVRPLTLTAYPFYLAAFALCLWRPYGLRGVVTRGLSFTGGTLLVLAPWLFRQWLAFGIVSLSDNTADNLYAATSPEYGAWSGELYNEPGYAPKSVKEKYEYFMDKAKNNLRNNPGFYIHNVASSYARFFQAVADSARVNLPFLVGVVVFGTYLIWAARGRPPREAFWVLLTFGCLGVSFLGLSRGFGVWFDLSILAMLPFVAHPGPALVHILGLLGSILGVALFGMGQPDERLLMMLEWSFLLTSLAFLGGCCSWILKAFPSGTVNYHLTAPVLVETSCPSSDSLPRWFRSIQTIVLIFIVISGTRLTYLNATTTVPLPEPRYLSSKQALEVVRKLDSLAPGFFQPLDLDARRILINTETIDTTGRNERTWVSPQQNYLLVLPIQLSQPSYHLPAGMVLPHWSRYFLPRGYDRTICFYHVEGIPVPKYSNCSIPVVFPGKLPECYFERDCVLICRIAYDGRHRVSNEEVLYEGLALIPRERDGGLRFGDAYLGKHPLHNRKTNSAIEKSVSE